MRRRHFTIYIGRLLKERGGHLHTIEEDPAWAKLLSSELEVEELQEVVTVVCAPLKDSRFSLNGEDWYDEEKVHHEVTGRVDLLIVDGPAGDSVRYPAVPFFKSRLADDYTIVLDDIRRGSREFLAKWEADLDISFRVLGHYAIGTTDPLTKVFVAPV